MTNGRTITIDVRATVDNLLASMKLGQGAVSDFAKTTEASVAQVEASTEKISRLWRAAFEAFIGVEAVKALKDIAEGASRAAESLAVASRVAANFGHALNASEMESWLEKFASSAQGGGYAISDMRDALQHFADVGLDAVQIQRALADTASLAAARNLDFGAAAHIVQMALTGHVEMLTRYGIISREAAKNIHTVEQAMQALEKATKGAAEERASRLSGEFGRLATAASLLGDAIGKGLEPFFTELAIVLTNVANALQRIPTPLLNFLATAVALGTSLVALTLILPAIAKGIAIVGEGFQLLMAVGSPLITLITRIAATFGLASTGADAATGAFVAFDMAQVASLGTFALVVAAIAGVVVAVVEIVNHLDHVKTAWHDWTQYLGDAFHEFVENFRQDHRSLLEMISDIAGAIANPAAAGTYLSRMVGLAPHAAIKDGPSLTRDTDKIGADIVGDWRKIANSIFGFFKGTLGNVKIPSEAFSGTIPGKGGKDGSAAAAENALKNFDESTKNWLAGFQERVDAAKAHLDIAKERLADFDVKHPANEVMSDADQVERQRLVNAEIEAQRNLQARTLAQRQEEAKVAREYDTLAKSISASLKNHDQLVRSALDGAREHAKAARDLYLNYLQAGTALDTILKSERDARNARIDASTQAADDTEDQGLAARKIARDLQAEQLGHRSAVASTRRGGGSNALADDRLQVALAQLAVAAAVDAEAVKQDALARAREAYDRTQSTEDYNKLTQAQNALASATLDVTKAENAYALAQEKLIADQKSQWTNFIDGLIAKIGMPGLSSQGGILSFNPLALLLGAIEKSKAFADVMTIVTVLMRLFAQVIDAFRPVIDALLEVVIGVVKVFIQLWNAVASILRLLGIHIQFLELQNAAESAQAPYLVIYHDLPTQQQAYNSTGPLSLTAIEDAYNQLTNPLLNALQSDNLGGGLFGVLGSILGVLIAIKVIMALIGGSTGGGFLGGIAGDILKIFGWGGSGGAAAPSLQDALNAINALPGVDGQAAAVETGVTNAFAHGTSMTFSTFASAISGAFEGFMLGQVFSKMFGTSSPAWGEGLGAAGGILGGLLGAHLFAGLGAAAGPVGALAGAILGALIGGLIGPHWGPASNYPDRSNTVPYGTFVTDMTGNPGEFNGQTIDPGAQFNVAQGGTSLTAMLRDWVTSVNPKTLSSAQDSILQQLQALGGPNGALGILSEYNGMFTLQSGKQVSVQQYMALVDSFLQAVQNPLNQIGETLAQVAEPIKRAKENINQLADAIAAGTQAVKQAVGANQPNGLGVYAPSVSITHTGDINGFSDLDDFLTAAAVATERNFVNQKYLISGAPQTS